MKDYTIRIEKESEHHEVEMLVREAFWNVYRPGCTEHYILHCLRKDARYVRELGFIIEREGKLIGQVSFVESDLRTPAGTQTVLTLGPISILPACQHKGYGRALLDYSLEKAAELGYGAVFLEGDIRFYGKSGFKEATTYGITYHQNPETSPYFLCKELRPGFLDDQGEYFIPDAYFIDETLADDYDKSFPEKEKLRLPGQLFQE